MQQLKTLMGCLVLFLFAPAGPARADMQIFFNNRVSGVVNAPVSRPTGTGAGQGVSAQLMLVNQDGTLTALAPKTTFRTNLPAATFFVQGVLVSVPGIQSGASVTLRMRAWEGADFASSKLKGESANFQLLNNSAVNNLVGLKEFRLVPSAAH